MVWLSFRSALRFVFHNIIIPHPKFVVPPSDPDPLFRFSARARTYGSPSQTSAFGASPFPTFSGLSSTSTSPSVRKSTPRNPSARKKTRFESVTYSPVAGSPCATRIRGDGCQLRSPEAQLIPLSMVCSMTHKPFGTCIQSIQQTSGSMHGRSHGRSLRRSKGRVARIAITPSDAEGRSASISDSRSGSSIPSIKSHSFAYSAFNLELSPIMEDSLRSSSTFATPPPMETRLDAYKLEPVVGGNSDFSNADEAEIGLQTDRSFDSGVLSSCRSISLDSRRCVDTATHAALHRTSGVPSLMLTMPTPVLPSASALALSATPLESGLGLRLIHDGRAEACNDDLELDASDISTRGHDVPSSTREPYRVWEMDGEIKSRFWECGLWSSDSKATLTATATGLAERKSHGTSGGARGGMFDPSQSTGSNAGLAICSGERIQTTVRDTCDELGFRDGRLPTSGMHSRIHDGRRRTFNSRTRGWGGIATLKSAWAKIMGAFDSGGPCA
ncbi:hypothetical protein HGRIS_008751 [Hohenbuehelia grisea]|uniref:Uncharacterized protein n=1 Tax=Hohenbuehelia grisea TaxID=104357 RepID=A0ABR3J9F7_9AGAR